MKVIDCHAHPRPDANYFESFDRFFKHMCMHNIEQMIISDLGDKWQAFPDSATVRTANERVKEACATTGGRVHYLVYLNPQLDDWREEFERHRHSAVGVKLWVSLRKDGDRSLDRSVEVLEYAAKCDMPVLIHAFDRTDGLTSGSVGIDGIIELGRRVPQCIIVAAHICGSWRRTIKRAADFPENVVFDLSGGYPERTEVERLLEAFGSKRLLYGSDAPGRSFASQMHKVLGSAMSDSEQYDILYENSRRIFKLKSLDALPPADSLFKWSCGDLQEDHFCFCGESPWFDHRISVAELAEKMHSAGVKRAYAVSLNAASVTDNAAENKRFLEESSTFDCIKPLKAVDLRNMAQALDMLENMDGFAGVWVSPYLHNYQLDAPEYKVFFERCAELNIVVWINTTVSDDRFRCRDLVRRCVTNAEILAFGKTAPENKYILQGIGDHQRMAAELPEYFLLEYSHLSDGEYLAEDYTGEPERLLRGSEYPFRSIDAVDNVLQGVF